MADQIRGSLGDTLTVGGLEATVDVAESHPQSPSSDPPRLGDTRVQGSTGVGVTYLTVRIVNETGSKRPLPPPGSVSLPAPAVDQQTAVAHHYRQGGMVWTSLHRVLAEQSHLPPHERVEGLVAIRVPLLSPEQLSLSPVVVTFPSMSDDERRASWRVDGDALSGATNGRESRTEFPDEFTPLSGNDGPCAECGTWLRDFVGEYCPGCGSRIVTAAMYEQVGVLFGRVVAGNAARGIGPTVTPAELSDLAELCTASDDQLRRLAVETLRCALPFRGDVDPAVETSLRTATESILEADETSVAHLAALCGVVNTVSAIAETNASELVSTTARHLPGTLDSVTDDSAASTLAGWAQSVELLHVVSRQSPEAVVPVLESLCVLLEASPRLSAPVGEHACPTCETPLGVRSLPQDLYAPTAQVLDTVRPVLDDEQSTRAVEALVVAVERATDVELWESASRELVISALGSLGRSNPEVAADCVEALFTHAGEGNLALPPASTRVQTGVRHREAAATALAMLCAAGKADPQRLVDGLTAEDAVYRDTMAAAVDGVTRRAPERLPPCTEPLTALLDAENHYTTRVSAADALAVVDPDSAFAGLVEHYPDDEEGELGAGDRTRRAFTAALGATAPLTTLDDSDAFAGTGTLACAACESAIEAGDVPPYCPHCGTAIAAEFSAEKS